MRRGVSACAVGAALAMLAAVSGCGGGSPGAAAEAHAGTTSTEAPAAVTVTVAPAERRAVERTVEVVGTLQAWEDVTIGAKREGRVRRVLHDMGDRVKPGEPLVELETDDAQLAALQARSKVLAELAKLGMTWEQADQALKKFGISEALINGEQTTKMIEQTPAFQQLDVVVLKAQNNLNRQRSLYQRGAGTLEELQNIENDFKAAKAARENGLATARNVIATALANKVAFDIAEQALKDLTVRAPTPTLRPEGVTEPVTYAVAKRSVGEGQMLKAGDPVMELVIETPLRLRASVPERYSAEIRKGQPVRVAVGAFPGTTFDGKVGRINPSVDPVSRTFQVEAVIPNSRGMLRPGGFAKASVVTDRHAEATTVPLESVVRFAGVTKVFVVENGKARAVSVETGQEGPGWVEVVGDLPPGTKVVTEGYTQLADGTPVTVRVGKAAPPAAAARGESAPVPR